MGNQTIYQGVTKIARIELITRRPEGKTSAYPKTFVRGALESYSSIK